MHGGRSAALCRRRYRAKVGGNLHIVPADVFDEPLRQNGHPRGNPDNPLRGVFATRSPFRPNLIAQSQVGIISVEGNLIEIDGIDAFADTPVLDLKP